VSCIGIISKISKKDNMNNTDNSLDYEALIKNNEPIDTKDPAYEQIFKDLQGGLIKSYGRNYSLYIFIQFNKEKVNEVKHWIRDGIAQNVTSTWEQLDNTNTFKKEVERRRQQKLDSPIYYGKLCTNFFLSYQGYKFLGFDPDNAEINEPPFKDGMKKDWEKSYKIDPPPKDYWYNPPECWDVGKDGKDQSHALILLAHDCLEELKNAANTLIEKCEKIGKVVAFEAGYVLRDKNENAVGPFGFADGISQPLFLKSDYDKYCKNQKIEQWDPKASLNLILLKDPFGEPYSYGSYCVFQKLETNSKCFEKKVDELARQLECDRGRANALVIGRFKDGTPIALSEQTNQNDRSSISNNFNYADDDDGIRCPLQSHIRKVNPRRDKNDATLEKSRRTKSRIFRAGITYFDDPEAPKTSDMSQMCLNKLDYLNKVSEKALADNIESISGLLFICFQNSIVTQFSKLQTEWADDRIFPRADPKYLDPIIGHPFTSKPDQTDPDSQEWPTKKGNGENFSPYPFYGCVKNRGGEFFFAPSISCLKRI
jgi:deferrochelatase/peroxidase EfeB